MIDPPRRLAAALAGVGAVLCVLGWYQISGQPTVAQQLPYLASATIPGAALLAVGLALALRTPWSRRVPRPNWTRSRVALLHLGVRACGWSRMAAICTSRTARCWTAARTCWPLRRRRTSPRCVPARSATPGRGTRERAGGRSIEHGVRASRPAERGRGGDVSGGAADLAVAGLGTGAVAALSGLGVLATYRVTGVLNVAFGAVGMFGAYLVRALVRDAHLPGYAAGLIVVCCFAPVLGLCLEAAVFGPLQARAADAGRLLTAGFGVTVLLVGIATAVWGQEARTDAPSLLPGGTMRIGGVHVPSAVPIELGLVLVVALGLAWFSRGGPAIRAVIDDRRLAELAGLPARKLARIGWVAGTMLATLTGVLLAPQLRFDPPTLTLVIFETLGVAIAARLRSASLAIVFALGTAIGQAELTGVHLTGAAGSVLDAVRSNLFVVLLLFATWLTPAFTAPVTAAAQPSGRGPLGFRAAVCAAGRARRLLLEPARRGPARGADDSRAGAGAAVLPRAQQRRASLARAGGPGRNRRAGGRMGIGLGDPRRATGRSGGRDRARAAGAAPSRTAPRRRHARGRDRAQQLPVRPTAVHAVIRRAPGLRADRPRITSTSSSVSSPSRWSA